MNIENTVDVTDPCYNANVWCRSTIKNMAAGRYACYAVVSDEGDWGQRVARARIVFDNDSIAAKETQKRIQTGRSWRGITEIGVDAGLAGFFANKPDFNDEQWSELCSWMFKQDKRAYLKRMDNGTDGFWTESGYGDGGYPVYAIRELVGNKPCITALEIRFI